MILFNRPMIISISMYIILSRFHPSIPMPIPLTKLIRKKPIQATVLKKEMNKD